MTGWNLHRKGYTYMVITQAFRMLQRVVHTHNSPQSRRSLKEFSWKVELTTHGASSFCLLLIPLHLLCLLQSSHIFRGGGYHLVIATGVRVDSMVKWFVGLGGGVYRKTDHFRHTRAYHNTDELATWCHMMSCCHDIHALLHGFFHLSFLYSHSQTSVNCIYLNAAMWFFVLLCYTVWTMRKFSTLVSYLADNRISSPIVIMATRQQW